VYASRELKNHKEAHVKVKDSFSLWLHQHVADGELLASIVVNNAQKRLIPLLVGVFLAVLAAVAVLYFTILKPQVSDLMDTSEKTVAGHQQDLAKTGTGIAGEQYWYADHPYVDITACDDFPSGIPLTVEDSKKWLKQDPTSPYYAVCRSWSEGTCYLLKNEYKKERVPGCEETWDDPRGDKCYDLEIQRIYTFDGKLFEESRNPQRGGYQCAPTTKEYFESKVNR